MAAIDALLFSSGQTVENDTGTYLRKEVPEFRGQFQAAENWCWAAVAASVNDYYLKAAGRGDPPTTQCALADADLIGFEPACKDNPSPRSCARLTEANEYCGCINRDDNGIGYKDRQGFLNLTLERLGVLEKSIVLGSGQWVDIPAPTLPGGVLAVGDQIDFDEIKALIDMKRPVCLRIVRREFRHFIVIYGYEGYPDNDLLVWDPAEGSDVVDFDILREMYGPFSHKLITKPPPAPAGGQ